VTEAEILREIIVPGRSDLDAAAANSILSLGFSPRTKSKIRSLLQANNRGAISATQRVELEKYLRVGQLVDLLHAKARLSLRNKKAA
jgi:hypothetical protein